MNSPYPHLQETDSKHTSSRIGGTSSDIATLPRIVTTGASEPLNTDHPLLPVIHSTCAFSSTWPTTGRSHTGKLSSPLVYTEPVSTRSSHDRLRVTSVDDLPCLSSSTLIACCTSSNFPPARLQRTTTMVNSMFNSGRERGDNLLRNPKELVRSDTCVLPVAGFDEAQERLPPSTAETRYRRVQPGFRGDDQLTMRTRLTKFNRNMMTNNQSKTPKNSEMGSGTQCFGNVPGTRVYRYRSKTGVGRPVAFASTTRMKTSTGDSDVRQRQPPPVKYPTQTTTRRQTQRRNGGRTMGGDDLTEEDQRWRIIDWLNGVGDNVELPPSPNIDDSPRARLTQTDTAIHIIYDGD